MSKELYQLGSSGRSNSIPCFIAVFCGMIALGQLSTSACQAQTIGAINPANLHDGRILMSNPASAAMTQSRAYLGLKLLYPGLIANNNFALKASSFNFTIPAIGRSGFAAGLHGRYLSSPLFQEGRFGLVTARPFAERFSIGVDLAFLTKNYAFDNFDLVDVGDPVFANHHSLTAFDPSAGVYGQITDRLAIAASLFHLTKPNVALGDDGITLPREGLIGVNFAGPFLRFDAGVQYRRRQLQPLLGGELFADRLGRLRLGYSLQHAIIEGQLNLAFSGRHPRASLFYAFNLPTSELGLVSTGSHEFAFLFTLPWSSPYLLARAMKSSGGPDFSMTATPLSQMIFPHQAARYYLSTTRQSGRKQPIKLEVRGLPAGLTAKFSAQETAEGVPVVLTLAAERELAPGDYTFIISARRRKPRVSLKSFISGNRDQAVHELPLHLRVNPIPTLRAEIAALTDTLDLLEWRHVSEELPVIPRIFFTLRSSKLDTARYELLPAGPPSANAWFGDTTLTSILSRQYQSKTAGNPYQRLRLRSLAQAYRQVLNLIGERLRQYPQARITLIGHSPGYPHEDDPAEMARQRADHVATYLTAVWGVSLKQIQTTISIPSRRQSPRRHLALRDSLWREESCRVDIIASEQDEALILAPLTIYRTEVETQPQTLGFVTEHSIAEAGLAAWRLHVVNSEADTLRAQPVVVFTGTNVMPDTIWWPWNELYDPGNEGKRNEWRYAEKGSASTFLVKNNLWKIAGDTLRYSFWLRDGFGREVQSPWQNIYIRRRPRGAIAVEIERIPIILFGFNQHKLDRKAKQFHQKIIQIADKLKSDPDAVCLLNGFTDAIGPAAYNLHLSMQRARTVYHELAKLGIARTRMHYGGFGEEQPLGENHLPEGRIMNRRVEVYIGYGGSLP